MRDDADRRPAVTVGVVILCWEEATMTLRAVKSFLECGADEVVVVDNGSSTEVVQCLTTQLPSGVELISLPTNIGFARGMNVGLRSLNSVVRVAANNDLEVSRPLVEEFRGVGDRAFLFAADGPEADGGRPYPSIGRAAGTALGLQRIAPERFSLSVTSSPDWYEGPCIAAKANAWAEVGFIPERHFMYGEEMLLALRIDRCGASKSRSRHHLAHHVDAASANRRWSRPARETASTWAYWESYKSQFPLRATAALTVLLLGSIPRLALRNRSLHLARAKGYSRALFGRQLLGASWLGS